MGMTSLQLEFAEIAQVCSFLRPRAAPDKVARALLVPQLPSLTLGVL